MAVLLRRGYLHTDVLQSSSEEISPRFGCDYRKMATDTPFRDGAPAETGVDRALAYIRYTAAGRCFFRDIPDGDYLSSFVVAV